MTVLMIGGPLDGELREVGYGARLGVFTHRTDAKVPVATYHIANGIARHDRQPVPEPQPQGDGTPIEPIRPITTQRKESKS